MFFFLFGGSLLYFIDGGFVCELFVVCVTFYELYMKLPEHDGSYLRYIHCAAVASITLL